MHNPKSVPENERHKLLLDVDIQTGYLFLARRPVIVKKQTKKKRGTELAEMCTLPFRLITRLKQRKRQQR